MEQSTIDRTGQTVVLPLNIAGGGKTRIVGEQEKLRIALGTMVSDVPSFRYGASAVAQRLDAESAYISQIYRQQATFGFDPNIRLWYVHLPEFSLPPGWQQRATPILITVTDQYPTAAPDGFYLSNRLRHENGSTPAHYFETSTALNLLAPQGWAWFCVHPLGWRSQYDLRDGDSVAKYLTLIHLTMSQVVTPNFSLY